MLFVIYVCPGGMMKTHFYDLSHLFNLIQNILRTPQLLGDALVLQFQWSVVLLRFWCLLMIQAELWIKDLFGLSCRVGDCWKSEEDS